MNTERFWNITAQGREAEVDIFGVIGDLGFFGESVGATNFIRDLRGVGKNITRLNVNLYSEGGSVWDGLAIYRALVDFQAEKVMHVSTLAASIASVIMLAGDRIEVAPEATVMIHDPLMLVFHDSESSFEETRKQYATAKDKILNIYERKTGQDRGHLSDLMTAETWMTGDEIKAAGFADAVKKDQPKSRMAAGPLTMGNYWRNAPTTVVSRKPAPLKPETAERLHKLKAFNG